MSIVPRFASRLGVVTHVPHWAGEVGPRAYEPYVREMEIWARLFAQVDVCAPRGEGPMRGNLSSYSAPNINWVPVNYSMGYRAGARMRRLLQIPPLCLALHALVRQSDIVLLRSPGHPALLARPLVRLRGAKSITKWAGFFGAFDGERVPSRVERRLAELGPGPVLIYGPAMHKHLISFPPALMSRAELDRAADLGKRKCWAAPWRILSVGRLLPVKGFDLALEGLALLRRSHPEVDWRYTLVGDGSAAPALHELARRLQIADRVTFTGALNFAAVQEAYGVAHAVIMPGVKEGWPKPIAEAWAHGAVPVAAAAGIVPWIIDGGAGMTFRPTPEALRGALSTLLNSPRALRAEGERGYGAANELSLEAFATRLEQVLVERCHLT